MESLEVELQRACRALVVKLAPSSATVLVKRRPEIDHDGMSIWIVPSQRSCAPISVDAKDGSALVGIVLGMGTRIEIQVKKDEPWADNLNAICTAVFEGRFEETVWLVGDEVVRCVGKLTIKNKVQKFYYVGRFFLFKRKVKKVIHYAPYGAEC